MKIRDLIEKGKKDLKDNKIEDYDIISKLLIEHVCSISRSMIIVHQEDMVDDEKEVSYKKCIEKIIKGTPVQYITNSQEFMALNFYVDENVLIPQPDTELIVEEIIENYKSKNCKIMDLCTGSGAIGISIAKYIEGASIVATDISTKAIQISKLNAEKNLVRGKIRFIESDIFEKIDESDFDVIVSNPPYIETDVINKLSAEVKCEPHIALDGGEDGLKFYRLIVDKAWSYIKNGGQLFLEIGYNQRELVEEILIKNGKYYNIYSKKDLGGNDRIIVATVRR